MLSWLAPFISHYGLLALGLLILLESAGLPLPGETVLLIVAASAAQGLFPFWAVLAVAAGSAIAGDSLGYWAGRRYGLALLQRYGRWLRVTPQHLDQAQRWFDQHGPKTVFLGRFVALLRVLAAFLAGVGRMPYGIFLRYNVLGGICWALLIGMLGYVGGRNLPVLERWLRQVGWIAVAAIGVVVLGVIIWRRVQARRQEPARPRSLPRVMQLFQDRPQVVAQFPLIVARLMIGVIGVYIFGQIADSVVGHESLATRDMALAVALHQHTQPLLTSAMIVITDLGSYVAVAVGALVVALLAWRRRWADVTLWIAALGGGEALNLALKAIFQRPRPVLPNPLVIETDWGFPSGHVMAAMIVYGALLALLVPLLARRVARIGLTAGLLLLISLIGFSRLYLGVHFLTDVLAGYAAGVAWLALCLSARVAVPAWRAPTPPVLDEQLHTT